MAKRTKKEVKDEEIEESELCPNCEGKGRLSDIEICPPGRS